MRITVFKLAGILWRKMLQARKVVINKLLKKLESLTGHALLLTRLVVRTMPSADKLNQGSFLKIHLRLRHPGKTKPDLSATGLVLSDVRISKNSYICKGPFGFSLLYESSFPFPPFHEVSCCFPATFGKNVVKILCWTKHSNSTGFVKRNKSSRLLCFAGR
jgi:hypothetical protein